MEPDIGSESRFVPTIPAFDAPVRGGGVPRRNIAMTFGMEKLEVSKLFHPKLFHPTVKQF